MAPQSGVTAERAERQGPTWFSAATEERSPRFPLDVFFYYFTHECDAVY